MLGLRGKFVNLRARPSTLERERIRARRIGKKRQSVAALAVLVLPRPSHQVTAVTFIIFSQAPASVVSADYSKVDIILKLIIF